MVEKIVLNECLHVNTRALPVSSNALQWRHSRLPPPLVPLFSSFSFPPPVVAHSSFLRSDRSFFSSLLNFQRKISMIFDLILVEATNLNYNEQF